MSDFDKEAERERLREKYGEDDEDREATEQMSELLLKGATMTNAHCNNCGDPIFRYDGQEFCPTCQQPVDRADAEGEAGADNENIEVTTPSDEATVQFGGADQQPADQNPTSDAQDGASAESTTPAQNPSPAQQPGDSPSSPTQQPGNSRPSPGRQSGDSPLSPSDRGRTEETRAAPSLDPGAAGSRGDDRGTAPGSPEPAGQHGDATAHLTNAQALLAETVEQYAGQARDADSPRQAREYLEAAREAAETLDATGY